MRVEEASRHLTVRTGHAPSVGELAQYLELDTEQVLAGLEAGSAHFAISLDAPVATADLEDPEPLLADLGEVEDGMPWWRCPRRWRQPCRGSPTWSGGR